MKKRMYSRHGEHGCFRDTGAISKIPVQACNITGVWVSREGVHLRNISL